MHAVVDLLWLLSLIQWCASRLVYWHYLLLQGVYVCCKEFIYYVVLQVILLDGATCFSNYRGAMAGFYLYSIHSRTIIV
jgi:hypothetical protein